MLTYQLKIFYNKNEITIPIYYMFVNKNNNIFNIFINFYIFNNPTYKKNNLLSFNFNIKDNNKYISLTYKFDIFNISLFCNKFFDVIPLFILNLEKHEINERLKIIFQ